MGALLVSFTGCQTNPARKHTSKNSSTSAIAEIGKGKKKAAKKAEESAKVSKTSKASASTSSAHVEYAKPEPKAAPKPAATVAKPEAKVEPKPAAQPEAKPAAPAPKPEAKVEPKPAAKPEAKPAAPAPKPEAKVEPKPATPAMKPETKPAAQPDKPAAKPEPALAAGAVRPQVPNSFTWDYTFDPPGKRTWKLSEKTYTQTLPNGKTEKFNIVKPITVENISGTLVQQEGTALQAFVPDKGSNPMHLKMRGSDAATWGFIGEMKDVDSAP